MEPRALVGERGLVANAATAMATTALTNVEFEALAAVKQGLRRFFSNEPWEEADADQLATAVGAGEGWWTEPLDAELTVEFGWKNERFTVLVTRRPAPVGPQAEETSTDHEGTSDELDLSATFEGAIVPEATPNPRTIAFRTPTGHRGESRAFTREQSASDPRVAVLFARAPEVNDVLLARDFVAVSLRRPNDWERLLPDVLESVREAFGDNTVEESDEEDGSGPGTAMTDVRGVHRDRARSAGALDRAWSNLGELRWDDADDRKRLLAAANDSDPANRQVAAVRLGDTDIETARPLWAALARDESRRVRRAAVDAVAATGDASVRPILESALGDDDAWVRWKALRGLRDIGPTASQTQIEAMRDDTDFRVRLEAHRALR